MIATLPIPGDTGPLPRSVRASNERCAHGVWAGDLCHKCEALRASIVSDPTPMRACPRCHGDGLDYTRAGKDGEAPSCLRCNGSGEIRKAGAAHRESGR